MYRVSPLTYLVDGIAGTGLHARMIECSNNELSRFAPPAGQTCGEYLSEYASLAGGQILNPSNSSMCEYCSLTTSDQYLAQVAVSWSTRWRNYGIGFSYIVFNMSAAVMLYYFFRVKKWRGSSIKKGPSKVMQWIKLCGLAIRAVLIGHHTELAKTGSIGEKRRKGNPVF